MRGVPQLDGLGQVMKWFGTCTDIDDFKLAEIEIVRSNRALKLHSECSQATIRAQDEQGLLDAICGIAVRNGGYCLAWVGLARDDAAKSITPVAHAGAEDGYLDHIKVTWDENDPSGQGPSGCAIRTGQAVACADSQTAPFFRALAGGRG